jgi:hypothetical protein
VLLVDNIIAWVATVVALLLFPPNVAPHARMLMVGITVAIGSRMAQRLWGRDGLPLWAKNEVTFVVLVGSVLLLPFFL